MAKLIVGHISRTLPEIVEILLKGGTYSCPMLPHYRYDAVKNHCRTLKKLGLIVKSGLTNVGVNYKPTDFLRDWKKEYDEGATTLQPVKWAKEKRKGKNDCNDSQTETEGAI